MVPYLAGSLIMVATSLGASIPSARQVRRVFHVLTVLALSVWSVPTEEAAAVGVLAHGVTITCDEKPRSVPECAICDRFERLRIGTVCV
jgi:hypothetical protein